MKACRLLIFLAAIAAAAFLTPPVQGQPEGPAYRTGYSALMQLGRALHDALDNEQRALISPQPISMDVETAPFARPMYLPASDADGKPMRGVWISAGFIDLVNQAAHAQAIDKVQKNYFQKYMLSLAQPGAAAELKPLPDRGNPKFWSADLLNEQQSNFNSIVGIVAGINLAHHTLGHYEKYQVQLAEKDGKPARPINDLLTNKEWEAACKAGLLISLKAGCFIEGAVPFYESFDKMPARPAWAVYFLPSKVKFSAKMKRDFTRLQDDFLKRTTE